MLYNGWTPSEAMIKRMEESRLQNDFRHKLLTLTTEADADRLHELIYDAEVMELPADVQDIVKWQDETEATRNTDRPY